MQIRVSGKKMEVGASLTQHVEAQLTTIVSKYFERAIEADVVFSKEAHLFCTDITINEGTGNHTFIKAQGKADDAYVSFDMAAERAEKQLRRYKRRLKNHHKTPHAERVMSYATKYVIANNDVEEEAESENPLIIAEKQTVIEKLSVSDAVMRMNLANLPALMFMNDKSGKLSIVYHRRDGNISWVEIEQPVSSAA